MMEDKCNTGETIVIDPRHKVGVEPDYMGAGDDTGQIETFTEQIDINEEGSP